MCGVDLRAALWRRRAVGEKPALISAAAGSMSKMPPNARGVDWLHVERVTFCVNFSHIGRLPLTSLFIDLVTLLAAQHLDVRGFNELDRQLEERTQHYATSN